MTCEGIAAKDILKGVNIIDEIKEIKKKVRSIQENSSPTTGGSRDGNIDQSLVGAIPLGGIILWSGLATEIPEGWIICDGLNGSPNLQDMFVVGAGLTYAVGDTGGSVTKDVSHTHGPGSLATDTVATHTHGPGTLDTDNDTHSHDVTGSTASDSHTHDVTGISGGVNVATSWVINTGSAQTVHGEHNHTDGSYAAASDSHSHGNGTLATDNDTHDHTVDSGVTGADGDHSHTVDSGVTDTGGSIVQDILPPYYALTYIMRIT